MLSERIHSLREHFEREAGGGRSPGWPRSLLLRCDDRASNVMFSAS